MRAMITALLLLTNFSIGLSTTHRVPQDFAKIQSAINAAVNGDTILVSEGTYFENLVITKKIVVGSLYVIDKDTSHISKTIINGNAPSSSDSMSVVTIDGPTDTTTVLKGFTITGGKGNRRLSAPPQSWYWRTGTGIDVAGGGVRISNNIIRNNNNANANDTCQAAVSIWDPMDVFGISYVIIENNIVSDNVLTGTFVEAAGIAVGHNAIIRNNTITRNSNAAATASTGSAGGVSIWNGTISFVNNMVTNNSVIGKGGGLYIYGGILGSIVFSPTVTLMNNIIMNNTAGTYGGGIAFENSLAHLYSVNNTIAMNSAGAGGSGIRAAGNATLRALNTIFWNPAGIEISVSSSTINAVNCNIRGGYAGTGNINADPQFVAGDTLYRLRSTSPCVGAGAVSATVGDMVLTAPATDFVGGPRPNPSWSRCDLGAVESPYAIPGHSAVHRVPQDFATVQSAINAAQESDLVLVAEGTYTENLVINKKITLTSLYYQDQDTSHISKTILDGGSPPDLDSGSVIFVGAGTDSTTQIMGFTIRNGLGTRQLLNGVNWRGGFGIYIAAGAARISHNIITSNSLTSSEPLFGGGIAVVPTPGPLGYWIIEYNSIMHNYLSSSVTNTDGGIEGGGLRLSLIGRVTHNLIFDNSVHTTGGSYAGGGGVYAGSFAGFALASMPSTQVNLANNEIRGNSSNGAGGWGGGIGTVVGRDSASPSPVSTTILNNIVCGNTALLLGSAIHFQGGSHVLVNNTITGNTGKNAIEVQSYLASFTLRMLNNILWNPSVISEYTVGGGSYTKNRYSYYNLVRGGLTGTGNINADPLFVAGDTLYRLQGSSPALSAGVSHAVGGGIDLYAPKQDYLGNVRPRPALMRSDLGAIEHDSGNVVDPTGVREIPVDHLPTTFILEQNYPNPFNPSTTIRYAVPEWVMVRVSIHDLLGREIATLVDEEQTAGWKEVEWNATGISSGIYFYRIQAGTFIETKKMVLMK